MRAVTMLGVSALACAMTLNPPVAAQQAGPPSELQVLPVRGNVYMLVGAGANITLSVGREGTLLVDSGSAAMSDNVIAAVQQLARQVTASPMPIRPCAGLGCAGVLYPS